MTDPEKLKALVFLLRQSIADVDKQLRIATGREDWIEAGEKAAYLRGLQFALTGIYTIYDELDKEREDDNEKL